MKVSDFHFDLPAELIAQEPLAERSSSRMLVVNRETSTFEDRQFTDFPDYIRAGDKLVVNNTRVLPARLVGSRAGGGGGRVEALLVKRLAENPPRWEALVRPAKRIRTGESLLFPEGLEAKVVETGEGGIRQLEFASESGFYEALEAAGSIPLPPYIKRAAGASDRERYQTVYADHPSSAAAPTAGLHFTREILDAVEHKGASKVEITLEVGLGTFQPITSESVETHRLHSERYALSAAAAASLNEPGRVVAVGTTSVRTVEHCTGQGRFEAGFGETDIFVYPGYEFQAVGAMLTNFHLPESSLLMLVCAFAGKELALAAYRHAVAQRYRFYSYGDCMLIV